MFDLKLLFRIVSNSYQDALTCWMEWKNALSTPADFMMIHDGIECGWEYDYLS